MTSIDRTHAGTVTIPLFTCQGDGEPVPLGALEVALEVSTAVPQAGPAAAAASVNGCATPDQPDQAQLWRVPQPDGDGGMVPRHRYDALNRMAADMHRIALAALPGQPDAGPVAAIEKLVTELGALRKMQDALLAVLDGQDPPGGPAKGSYLVLRVQDLQAKLAATQAELDELHDTTAQTLDVRGCLTRALRVFDEARTAAREHPAPATALLDVGRGYLDAAGVADAILTQQSSAGVRAACR